MKARLLGYARRMRRQPTLAESRVWRWLRDRRFGHWKFRRQHAIREYILDFYCAELKLGIELDGRGHEHPGKQSSDSHRDYQLSEFGITIVRITNETIQNRPDDAAEAIRRHVDLSAGRR